MHADFSDSFSIPSQPPDIKNWFSSYQYESPDDSSDLPSFDLPENDDSETQDPSEIFRIPIGVDSSTAKDTDLVAPNESCFKADYIQLSNAQNQLAGIGGQCEDGKNGNVECNYPVDTGNSIEDPEEFPGRPIARLQREEELPQSNHVVEKDDNGPGTGIKVEKFMNSTDGFISTKKRERPSLSSTAISINTKNNRAGKTIGEKVRGASKRSTSEGFKENKGILAGREEAEAEAEAGRATSALADRTNIRTEQGVSGKWRCPRTRKPYVGPPMKQLRLEQWVRRAN